MNEALCSILSGEEWSFDLEGRSIKFNNDGTGELWCRCNFNVWIAAELQWKSLGSLGDSSENIETPSQAASSAQGRGPRLLGQLNVEITLEKRLPESVRTTILSKSTIINELSLTDEAFRPKSYTLRIERGNFIEPCYVGFPSADKPRFALRLIFNKSPYPPRPEWRKPDGGPDGGQFWDHVEFVARVSPELSNEGKAMNDISAGVWDGCTVF
ncbi:hypothetical protein F5Y11DRAFT_333834 [Daldinia sp. FL1419]|nr:hypothetical protein F5Y11DRAFT_333834 [Daldinia sp. FL1419]